MTTKGDDAHARDDDDDDEDDGRFYATLAPCGESARAIAHVDRAKVTRARDGASARVADDAPLTRKGMKLRLKSTVIGRIVMNKEGTARAKAQPADLAMDLPSGASFEGERERDLGLGGTQVSAGFLNRARAGDARKTRGRGELEYGRER